MLEIATIASEMRLNVQFVVSREQKSPFLIDKPMTMDGPSGRYRLLGNPGLRFRFTGTKSEIINVGSYNYLGFAQNNGPCADNSINVIDELGLSTCSTVHELGQTKSQTELEELTAEFLGVEDAMVFSMGFATNSLNIPCLLDKVR